MADLEKEEVVIKKSFLSNTAYDILKVLEIIVLPACGTLYSALSSIWGWPYGEEILKTLAAVETFIGALLVIATTQYNSTGE